MDEWSNLCRCCLSPESQVSLLNVELNVKEKFFEITAIKVTEDDGLPQKLCKDCYSVLNSAYQFRRQCLKMEHELRVQLEAAIMRQTENEKAMLNTKTEEIECQDNEDINMQITENDPMKQLEAIVKMEPNDSDEDFYLFLVINDKDKENTQPSQLFPMPEIIDTEAIKSEKPDISDKILQPQNEETQNSHSNFENSIDSFLVSDKIPPNVPATILENEEDSQGNENFEIMNVESHDSNSQSELPKLEVMDEVVQDDKNSFIKILTTSSSDGTILLQSNDKVAYLTDTQLITNDGDEMSQEEVIFCEGDDSSQFQILKCEGSELVIEYADEGQISTVLQQEDGTFLCDCGEQFEGLTEYEEHQHTHNPAGEHLCNLCGKGFESAEILKGHTLLHNVPGLLIMCPFCNLLVKRNGLNQHIKYGHNNIKPRCNVCFKTFANPNNLKRHMMIHTGIREFECDICFKRFRQKITMQTHRITHMDPFSCGECDKSFDNKAELTAHKESQECSKSKVAKVTEELMKTVKQEITTSTGKLLGYACSLCKKMFSIESALERHIESIHIVNPIELLCSECGEVLPSKKEMQSHIMTHKNVKLKNVKRFECSICGKGCASQAMLVMHERVHTNERPFPCGLCALRFKTKTHLRTHQLTHTREKKYGCSICLKFFALKGNLVVHLRTHTGERPYVCSLCNEAFIDSKYLKKHKLKKHAIDNVPWNKY